MNFFPRAAGRFSRDLLLLTASKYGQYLVTLITLPLVARTIGVTGAGLFGVGSAAYFFGSILGDLGLSPVLGARLASIQSPPEVHALRLNFVALRACVFIAFVCLAVLALVLNAPPVFIYGLIGLVAGATSSLGEDWILASQGRFFGLTASQTLGRLVYLVLVVTLLWVVRAPWWPLLALALGNLVSDCCTWCLVGRVRSRTLSVAHIRALLRDGISPSVAKLITAAYGSGATLLYSAGASTHVLGLYSSSDRLIRAASSALDAMSVALYPRFVSRKGTPQFRKLALNSLVAAAGVGAVECAVVCVSAELIVGLLYGPHFSAVTSVLRVSAFMLPATSVSSALVTNILLVANDGTGVLVGSVLGVALGLAGWSINLAMGVSADGIALAVTLAEWGVAAWMVYRGNYLTKCSSVLIKASARI